MLSRVISIHWTCKQLDQAWAAFKVCNQVGSMALVANLHSGCALELTEASHFWNRRQKWPTAPLKWLSVSANESCFFNCKWLPAMGAPVLLRVTAKVLSIANGSGMLLRCTLERSSSQVSMVFHISCMHRFSSADTRQWLILAERRLPMKKGGSSIPSWVKPMTYQIDTCHFLVWCSAFQLSSIKFISTSQYIVRTGIFIKIVNFVGRFCFIAFYHTC